MCQTNRQRCDADTTAIQHAERLTPAQRASATDVLIRNLHEEDDWIALNMSMKTLAHWVKRDPTIVPRVETRARALSDDRRKSVAKGALKLLNAMDASPL